MTDVTRRRGDGDSELAAPSGGRAPGADARGGAVDGGAGADDAVRAPSPYRRPSNVVLLLGAILVVVHRPAGDHLASCSPPPTSCATSNRRPTGCSAA